jgi:magnesium and cobalt transporter
MPDIATSPSQARTWLERLGLALLGGEARSHDDLLEELRLARQNGVLDADTLRMLEGVLSVNAQTIADVMVPRAQMTLISLQQSFPDILAIAMESGHSRFPVMEESDSETVVGILLAKDLLKCVAANQIPCDLRTLLRPARLVPESKRLSELLKDFRHHRAHMAVVVNEYGGIAGLVTIEDVLEEIVGPIDDEHDAEDKPETFVEYQPDGSALVRALIPIAEFNQSFDALFSDDDRDTMGGLLVQAFGHLPEIGEDITLDGFRFEVVEADDRRLHALRVSRIA